MKITSKDFATLHKQLAKLCLEYNISIRPIEDFEYGIDYKIYDESNSESFIVDVGEFLIEEFKIQIRKQLKSAESLTIQLEFQK